MTPEEQESAMVKGRNSRTTRSLVVLVTVLVSVATAGAQATASDGSKPPELEFLGQAIVPTGTMFASTTVGGLSSIAYDEDRGAFYALSDDQGQFQPARFYTLRLDVSDGQLGDGDVHFDAVSTRKVLRSQRTASSWSRPRGSRRGKLLHGYGRTTSTAR